MPLWNRNTALWPLLGAMAAALAAVPAHSQDGSAPPPLYSVELAWDYSSRYLFRGIDVQEGRPTSTPHLIVRRGGLAAYYYGYSGDLGEDGPAYEEHDFGLDYTWTRDRLSLILGAVAYTYGQPADFDDTTEVYGLASLDVLLEPTLSLYWDVDLYGGGYASFGLAHDLPLVGERLTLGLSTTLGYDLGYYSDIYATGLGQGWNDLLLGADLSWEVHGPLAVHLGVQRSIALEVLDAAGQEDETVYTVGTALSF